MFRLALFRSTSGSWENLHLSPFLQRPCLKNAQKTDFGSTPCWTFWAATGRNKAFFSSSSFFASSFLFFSANRSSSCFLALGSPPDFTCFSTWAMNFWFFDPFLFLRPKVLSWNRYEQVNSRLFHTRLRIETWLLTLTAILPQWSFPFSWPQSFCWDLCLLSSAAFWFLNCFSHRQLNRHNHEQMQALTT